MVAVSLCYIFFWMLASYLRSIIPFSVHRLLILYTYVVIGVCRVYSCIVNWELLNTRSGDSWWVIVILYVFVKHRWAVMPNVELFFWINNVFFLNVILHQTSMSSFVLRKLSPVHCHIRSLYCIIFFCMYVLSK